MANTIEKPRYAILADLKKALPGWCYDEDTYRDEDGQNYLCSFSYPLQDGSGQTLPISFNMTGPDFSVLEVCDEGDEPEEYLAGVERVKEIWAKYNLTWE